MSPHHRIVQTRCTDISIFELHKSWGRVKLGDTGKKEPAHVRLHKEGSDSLEESGLGKLGVRAPERLTLIITSTLGWVISKMEHGKGAGAYYEAPAMSATGE